MAVLRSGSIRALPILLLVLAGCAGTVAETGEPLASPGRATESPSPPDSADDTPASASAESPSPTAGESATPASPTDDALSRNTLVIAAVSDLSVRTEPTRQSERLGVIPAGEVAFVVDGPVLADGRDWYSLASDSTCPVASASAFHCQPWNGWVAADHEDGTPLLEPLTDACPTGPLDLAAFLDTTALMRLACFGDATWKLRAFIASSTDGRGGTSLFKTEPGWLDAWGSLVFPQTEPSQYDTSSALAMHAHPDLGCEFGGLNPGCAFAEFAGEWVIITGHHDDPAASTCAPTYNSMWTDSMDPPLPPLPDEASTILGCRSAFVATNVEAAP